jgi:hypothetical protein
MVLSLDPETRVSDAPAIQSQATTLLFSITKQEGKQTCYSPLQCDLEGQQQLAS